VGCQAVICAIGLNSRSGRALGAGCRTPKLMPPSDRGSEAKMMRLAYSRVRDSAINFADAFDDYFDFPGISKPDR
jgi:hypothetical protein